ncbi:MAG: hypothetical protein M1836_005854 [Candelina mexicana]|nr:MAG: hypothetical protein M1836_005854 [Candelina mexicana]
MAQTEEESTSRNRKRPTLESVLIIPLDLQAICFSLCFSSSINQTIVTVRVGLDAEPFLIHKDLLCFYSSYFRGALEGTFREARENTVLLSDDSVDVFRSFFGWLYTQQFQPSDGQDLTISKLARIYVFADKIGATVLKNQIIDSINLVHSRPKGELADNETIDHVFEHTPASSPLRQLLVDQYAYDVDPVLLGRSDGLTPLEWFLARPKEFIAGISIINTGRLPKRLKDEKAPFEMDPSRYHEKDEPVRGAPHALDGSKIDTT